MSLQDCRVLVVEDNYLMAEQMASLIEKAGAAVCGPFPTTGKALPLAVSEKLSGAILDVRLGDDTSVSIAQALRRRHAPLWHARARNLGATLMNTGPVQAGLCERPDAHGWRLALTRG